MLCLDLSLGKGKGCIGCAEAFKIIHRPILVALAYDRNSA
jgi:hypothetical protein